MIPSIHIEDYSYPLTDARIAKYPLSERDLSKLLIYREGEISEKHFKNLPDLIRSDTLMVFNDTKVVPARLHFRRESGAHIEIFCLQPVEPADYAQAFSSTAKCSWQCVIGNSKRWKDDILSYFIPESTPENLRADMLGLNLKARLISREAQSGVVEFEWDGGMPFSNVLDLCGNVPIPPYLNRETEAIDLERYQTVYAHIRGSVAAPTAGLHFTPELMEKIRRKGIAIGFVTLHVGLGTFRPVSVENVLDHKMHAEHYSMPAETAELIQKTKQNGGRVIAVGTTSCRTLESVAAQHGRICECEGWTDIFIYPGFQFKVLDALITNFHLPESTLVMLVSALAGRENILHAYETAVKEKYRFFSFGDAMLIE